MRGEPILRGRIGSIDYDPAGILRAIDDLRRHLSERLGYVGERLFRRFLCRLGTRGWKGIPDLIIQAVLTLKGVQRSALIERGTLQPNDSTIPTGISI